MKNFEEIRITLEKHKKELQDKYKVKAVGIFGSYLRNQQRAESDVDILVEYLEVPDLISFIELKDYLSDLLRMKVDLVMKSALKPNIGEKILREVVYL